MDAQREIVEQFKRDLPEIDAGRDPWLKSGLGRWNRAHLWRRESRSCDIPGCGRPHNARGMCNMHYRRVRRAELKAAQ